MRLIINNKAVTLMELIVVVVLIGLIAAFTIPDYKKSLQRSDEKEAINNLAMVWEAMKIYRVKTGVFRGRQRCYFLLWRVMPYMSGNRLLDKSK